MAEEMPNVAIPDEEIPNEEMPNDGIPDEEIPNEGMPNEENVIENEFQFLVPTGVAPRAAKRFRASAIDLSFSTSIGDLVTNAVIGLIGRQDNTLQAIRPYYDYYNLNHYRLLLPILKTAMNRPTLQINRVLRRSYVNVNKFYRIDPWTASLTVSDPNHILLKQVNLFIKQIPRNDKDNQRIKEMMIRERKFYKLVSPSIQHYLQIQLGGGHKDNLTISKNYDSPFKDLEILDHMGHDGFITLRRSRRLNVEHCRLVLKGLAHLHAISLVMNKEGIINFENEFPPLSMDIVGEYPIFENFYTYSLEALSREVWDWKGYESFAHVLHSLSSKASRHMKTFRGSKFGRLKTLVHGDCWVNNVMFRYSTGNLCNPISLGMIDFQQCRWGCPALDVNHFLFSSSNVDVMENHFGSLVDDYVKTVHQVITKLNYNISIFPKKEFIEDFHDSFIYGPILAFSHHVVDFQTDKLKADINSFVGSKALEEDSDWRKILQQEHVKNYFKLIFNKIKEKEYNVN